MDPEWSQSSVRPLNGHAVPGGSGRSSPTLSQDSGAPGLFEDNLGDKFADKLRPGLSEDNLGDKLADKLSPGIVRGQSGRQTGGQTGRQSRPGGRIGDNSALQDSGAPGLSEDNLGDKLADKLRPGLSEDNLGDKLARDCPRTIWATNWRTNWATI